jgi:DsbC/DsbD-like thiol-disulfide interchange protein
MHLLRALTALLLLSPALSAADKPKPLEIALVSSVRSIAAGESFYLGLSLHHGPGYHSYWKHGGIVGVPTSIQWEAHPGFTIDPIAWPDPEPVKMYEYDAQGYERDVVLPLKVTPKKGAKLPVSITFSGLAAWMCCNRECNPGNQQLSITLPLRQGTEPDLDGKWAPLIEKELSQQPQSSACWSSSVTQAGTTVTLTVQAKDGATPLTKKDVKGLRYFTLDGYINSAAPQKIELGPEGQLVLTLQQTDYVPGGKQKTLQGLILRKSGSWEAARPFRSLLLSPAW